MAGRIPQWTLGERLRKAREDAEMSQQQLADLVGISRRSVSAYESGDSTPRRPVLLAWALATGVNMGWLHQDEALRAAAQPEGSSNAECAIRDSNAEPADSVCGKVSRRKSPPHAA